MSDEYQLRKDVDRLIDDVYGVNSKLVSFDEDSSLRGLFYKEDMSDTGTLDAILRNYGVLDGNIPSGGGGGDLSEYVTETELNTILSSYATTQSLSSYALKSELFSGSYNDLTDKPSTFPPSSHTHDDRYYTESEIDSALNGKSNTGHTHTKSNITNFEHSHLPTEVSDNASDYTNIYRWSLPHTPSTVKGTLGAIDIALGEIVRLGAFEVVASKPTASASTMGKLYIVNENSKVNVYYTKESGTSPNYTYSWQKMDTDILDELSISWNDITNKPSIPSDLSDLTDGNGVIPTNTSDLVNDGSDGSDTYVETDDLGTVAFSNSYVDLDNIPQSFTPSSHTHGNLSNDGKLTTSVVTNKVVVTDSNNNLGVVTVDELNCGTFTELQTLIGSQSGMRTVILDKDYKNTGNESEITVPSLVTIIGNGHIIDADGKSRIFNLGEIVTLTGITFKNGKATRNSQNDPITDGYGGAIYTSNNYCSIFDCTFIDNNSSKGGAIYCTGQNTIKECSFSNNAPQGYMDGEWIYNSGTSFEVINCRVYGIEATSGMDDAPFYHVVNKSYLTDHQSLSSYLQTGDAVTSIALVPKGSDPTADAYNGVIRLYYGDEPSP